MLDWVNDGTARDPTAVKEAFKKDDSDATPALIYRNLQWLSTIISAINQKKDTAIIFGFGHLMGSTGMIYFLERMRYRVEHAVGPYEE